jgi:hypothetical protein
MMTIFRAFPWLIILISFALPAFFYHDLPDKVLIARGLFGGENITAQKSLFAVFRVPLIETLCAAAAEIMRRNFALVNEKFSRVWSILLYTAAFKSLFQSLETVSAANSASVFFYLTIAVVASGIVAALAVGRNLFSKSSRAVWKLDFSGKTILLFLLLGYLGLAIAPILYYK